MTDRKTLIVLLVFIVALVPVLVIALLTYRPGDDEDRDLAVPMASMAHAHATGLAVEVRDGMQLVFNVGPAAQLYQLVDGALEQRGDLADASLRHITVDVNDAALALGERLPVNVSLQVRRQDSGEVVVQASAPAMYSPGHGYHFGDNYPLPAGAAYDWTVTISPVLALRQEGAQDLWLEPVVWTGSFALDAEGRASGQASAPTLIGELTQDGLHIMLSQQDARPLYALEDGTAVPEPLEPLSRYYVVDITDHAVNYETKLLDATVTVTFRRYGVALVVPFPPVISPQYGFHYGANVALEPGDWTVEVEVSGLDFLRHAGAAVSLARAPVRASFSFTLDEPAT
ncbi:MAG: hypothetical protein KJ047_15370 [Anaerolineae bacterium]|nr:hypothetical protein [Anaerolineae bacterium]